MTKEIKDMTYEEALKELEEILVALERADDNLDASMEKFKKGIELYKQCSDILEKKEGEIKVLLEEDKEIEQNFLEGVEEDNI